MMRHSLQSMHGRRVSGTLSPGSCRNVPRSPVVHPGKHTSAVAAAGAIAYKEVEAKEATSWTTILSDTYTTMDPEARTQSAVTASKLHSMSATLQRATASFPEDGCENTGQAAAIMSLVVGAAMLPHVDKAATGGEDAFFTLPEYGVLGVADGVGGWSRLGVDPALYSRGLMDKCLQAALCAMSPDDVAPLPLLEHAQAANRVAGSATACVAVMGPDGELEVANVGDSGVRVIRSGQVIMKTKPQQWRFNQPYQLSHPAMHRRSGAARRDAEVYKVMLQPGDLVILGTDGLFDNLSDHSIAALAHKAWNEAPSKRAAPRHIASSIAAAAHELARDPHATTPWSLSVVDEGLGDQLGYSGGKMDDCTVVVGIVQERRGSP